MKWTKPGHEFDKIGEELCNENKRYIIWGAGEAGKAFYDKYSKTLNFVAFIDNDKYKQGKKYKGIEIIPRNKISKYDNVVVVICVMGYYSEIEIYLKDLGYKECVEFFYDNQFVAIFEMYKNSNLVMWHVNVPITDCCTLRCKNCSALIPYIKKPRHLELQNIIKDIDQLFSMTDTIHEFHLLGGEPMLYPYLSELIEYIGQKYKDRIYEFAIATNGTILADKKLLEICKKYNTIFIISDYMSSSFFYKKQKSLELCKQLDEVKIKYRYSIKDEWYDFGCPSTTKLSYNEDECISRFSKCRSLNRILRDGRLYYCHHQVGAVWSKYIQDTKEAYIELETFSKIGKKLLLEYSLGYTEKGYLYFCNSCNGYDGINDKIIPSAEQL